ncbi:hypothetical protein ACHAXR_000661, partial [Thalassiosira sp. AJA248-18]
MVVIPNSHRRRASAIILVATLLTTTLSAFPLQPLIGRIRIPITSGQQRHNDIVQILHSSPDDQNNESSNNGEYNTSSSSRRNRRKPQRITDKNLYDILGANPAMSRTAIKQRYIALAKETHPDSNNYASSAATTTDNSSSSSSSVNRFNEIAQAWTILSDAKTRRAYDRELAANDFKEDIVKKAGEVAREYGPTARKFYDDFAIPLLRRTTATTLAGWSAVTDSSAEGGGGQQQQQESGGRSSSNGGGRNGNGKANSSYNLSGVTTLTDVVKEVSQMERSNVGVGDNALEDFGKAFQRVIEAGRNATRQID